jgi:hypothetical protein
VRFVPFLTESWSLQIVETTTQSSLELAIPGGRMQWLVMLANDWRLLETVGWELLRHGFYTDVALQSARQPYKTSQHT